MKTTHEYRAWLPGSEFEKFSDTPHAAVSTLILRGVTPSDIKVALYRMEFFIAGVPKSRQSASFKAMFVKGKKRRKAWAFHKDKAQPWKDAAVKAAKDALGCQPATPRIVEHPGAYPATVELYYAAPIPERRNRKCPPGWPVAVRPDLGNLEKPLMDALQAAGLFDDDSRVYRKTEEKRYVGDGEEVGCRVVVFWKTQYLPVVAEKDTRQCRKSKSSKPSSDPKKSARSTSGSRSTVTPSWAGSQARR